MLLRLLAPLDMPVLAIPGNHYEREAFRQVVAQAQRNWDMAEAIQLASAE